MRKFPVSGPCHPVDSNLNRFLLDHSMILLYVTDVFLDPGIFRIGTDLLALFGEKDNTILETLATGFKIAHHVFTRDLPGDEGEAAGGWAVSSFLCVGAEDLGAEEDKDSSHEELHDAGGQGILD